MQCNLFTIYVHVVYLLDLVAAVARYGFLVVSPARYNVWLPVSRERTARRQLWRRRRSLPSVLSQHSADRTGRRNGGGIRSFVFR